jgi:hypothetical protein
MANVELTLLYPLRRPFTHASVKRNKISADIALEVDGEVAGTLRVPIGRVPHILLHIFADTNRCAGHIINGVEIEWAFSPDVYGYKVVIDDTGTLWDVRNLPRET